MTAQNGRLVPLGLLLALGAGIAGGSLALLWERADLRANLQPTDWLLRAGSEEARFRAIQKQLRGFDVTMLEVGERYERLHEALTRNNYPMAVYQWEKIGQVISMGIERRPRWAENARVMLLQGNFKDIRSDFAAADSRRAWNGFARAKLVCTGCHQASGVSYVNNQRIFELHLPDGGPQ